MDFALRASEMSYAKRLQVGCVVVKNDNIISFSWNGMPSGMNNECETNGVTNPETLHAERNALDKCARNGLSCQDATMFVTHSPCMECAKSIFMTGIKQVYYDIVYRDTTGINFLKDRDVKVIHYKEG